VLTVWKLDRLGRSLPHLIGVLESLKGQGVGFRSLTEAIDTESATGRLLSHIIGALAEFERGLIIEGCQAARREAGAQAPAVAATGATVLEPVINWRRQLRACSLEAVPHQERS
jgi:hypothetical protein